MNRSKRQIIGASLVLSLLIVLGAGLAARSRKPSDGPKFEPAVVRTVTKTELSKSDGKEGRDCLVAVDKVVYKITDSTLWQNGQHATSNGQAYCGADMTDAIGKSPHGRKKLDQLEKVGALGD